MAVKAKKKGFEMDLRTLVGADGATYLVFRTAGGSFHAFREVEAKQAARECGATGTGNTRQMWESIWNRD